MSLSQIKTLLHKASQLLEEEIQELNLPTEKEPKDNIYSDKEIVLEIGHGPHPKGFEPGAVCPRTGKREWDLNKVLGASCKKRLFELGYENIHVEDENDYLFSIGRKHALADVFVSIHHNAFSDPKAQGTESLIHPESLGTGHEKLAKIINKEIAGELDNIANRGVKTRSLGVLSQSTFRRHENNRGVVLIEPYFITGEDVESHEDWSSRAGCALARAIDLFFHSFN